MMDRDTIKRVLWRTAGVVLFALLFVPLAMGFGVYVQWMARLWGLAS